MMRWDGWMRNGLKFGAAVVAFAIMGDLAWGQAKPATLPTTKPVAAAAPTTKPVAAPVVVAPQPAPAPAPAPAPVDPAVEAPRLLAKGKEYYEQKNYVKAAEYYRR